MSLDDLIESNLAVKRLGKLWASTQDGLTAEERKSYIAHAQDYEADEMKAAGITAESGYAGLDEYIQQREAAIREAIRQHRAARASHLPEVTGPHGVPEPDDPRVAKALREDIAALAACAEGQRNSELNRTAGNLARLPINREALRDMLIDACHTNGLLSDDGHNQCDKTIESGFAFADREGPRTMPPRNTHSGTYTPPPIDGHADDTRPRFTMTTLSDVKPEKVTWLWSSRLPLGKLVVLDGDPGVGKSTLALSFAAAVTTGGEWPDGTRCEHPGDVLLLSAEDGLADTVRPRLDAAGADVARVHAIQGVPMPGEPDVLRMACLSDVEPLRHAISDTAARLLIVDVLMAYLPTETNSHRDQDMRQILSRLSKLAEETGCTVLLLRHLNKGKGDPLYRGGGSIGIVGAARVGLVAAPDPDDTEATGSCVLASLKNNLAPTPPSLRYRLDTDEALGVGRIQWQGVSDHDSRALLAERDGSGCTPGDEARNWLEDYLLEAGRVRSRDAKAEGGREGFSRPSIERAASKLKVVVQSVGFPRVTYWSLPGAEARPVAEEGEKASQSPQSPQSPHVQSTEVTEVTGLFGEVTVAEADTAGEARCDCGNGLLTTEAQAASKCKPCRDKKPERRHE